MRLFLLLCLTSAVLSNPIDLELTDVDHIDLQEILSDLFVDREGRQLDDVDDTEEGLEDIGDVEAVNEDLAGEEEGKSGVQETDTAEITRFNNYMDAIFRRMNAALRAKLMDPMMLNLDKTADKKKNNKKVKRDVMEVEDDEDEDTALEDGDKSEVVESEDKEEGRKMKRKNTKKGGKRKKKNNKKPGKKAAKNRNKNKKKGGKGRNTNKEAAEQKKANNKKNKETSSSDSLTRQKRNNGGKKRSNQKKNNHNKKNNKKSKNHKAKQLKLDDGKSMGSLTGIASLRRENDVAVVNYDTHKVIKVDFIVGPLLLEVSKAYKLDGERVTRTAKATTEVMKGSMELKVKPDGFAHVKKVVFKKPEEIEVNGTLVDQKRRSDTFVKNSVSRVRPYAAKRILKMARYVLKAPRVHRS